MAQQNMEQALLNKDTVLDMMHTCTLEELLKVQAAEAAGCKLAEEWQQLQREQCLEKVVAQAGTEMVENGDLAALLLLLLLSFYNSYYSY